MHNEAIETPDSEEFLDALMAYFYSIGGKEDLAIGQLLNLATLSFRSYEDEEEMEYWTNIYISIPVNYFNYLDEYMENKIKKACYLIYPNTIDCKLNNIYLTTLLEEAYVL